LLETWLFFECLRNLAKRADSLYESGKRSGAWVKHRINKGQEFVVGG
jgi:bifunctional non-homologous end joining protein LigD